MSSTASRTAGKTVVLVTHDMGTIEEYCDRAMLLHEGEIAQIGEPARGRPGLHAPQLRRASASAPCGASNGSAANEDVRVVERLA